MTIKLIIGLQNPGSTYEHTRHNAGAWFIQRLAQRHSIFLKLEKKMQAELAELKLESTACMLVLPTTFMNHSGTPVRAIMQFYRFEPEEILVIHDDLDLVPGRAKLKKGGSHGGHNGLRDIIAHLGSSDFFRLRLGIGHPGHKELVHQYVLSKPSAHDRQLIHEVIDRSLSAIPLVLSGDIARAMNQINA